MVVTKVAPAEAVSQRLWTCEEYEPLGEVGLIGRDERTELIEGVICCMAPQRSRGSVTMGLVEDALLSVLKRGDTVSPLAKSDASILVADLHP